MTTCATCAKTFESRPPHGWKHKGEAHYCPECWRKSYVLRAITMKVAEPLDSTWDELRPKLKQAWADTTACSNWMMTELYARDVRREGAERSQAKMPQMGRVYLYPEARKRFPNLPAQSVAAIEQAVQRKYRARRRDVIWTCSASLASFRYPTPYPVHNQSWAACIEQDRPVVSFSLGDGRQRFRLKGGPHYRRQMAAFRLMVRGAAERGELAVLQKFGQPLMVKMVAWLPRPEVESSPDGVLAVYTRKDALLQAVNGKDEALWTYNGDHLRRWIEEHTRQLQRWSEDQKFEQRPGEFKLRPDVATFQARRSAAVRKQQNRMDSALHEIAFQLATYARRRKFQAVRYDDTERGFLGEKAPWFRLRQLIGEKLDYFGIEFDASGPVEPKPQEPLADGEKDAES